MVFVIQSRHSSFEDDIHYSKLTFNGDIRCSKTTFKDDICYSKLTLNGDIRCSKTTFKDAGPEIATSESPMRLKIKLWRPKILNWSPAGNLPFPLEDFTLLKKIIGDKLVQVGQYSDIKRIPVANRTVRHVYCTTVAWTRYLLHVMCHVVVRSAG